MALIQTRRGVLGGIAAAGATSLIGTRWAEAAEGPLETTTVRIQMPGLCVIPSLYIAGEQLRAEGFTDVRYVEAPPAVTEPLAHGKADFDMNYASNFVRALDTGEPITLLSGVMVGCFELFADEGTRTITDLKGKNVGVQALESHELVTLMAALVGLDPAKDIHWVTDPKVKPIELFEQGKIDAFLAFPPEPQDLRARHIGHVIVNTAVDRPWSQYFCCMLAGNRDFVARYPVATKRVVRAILTATDLCAADPAGVARGLADGGRIARPDYAAQTLADNNYKWREFDPEDTIRWYALRLRETGFVKSSPQKIIADGTDWRFLNELKRELKA
ncbi:MAG: ABC transporter substrate-binding protein [Planctomycetaceae bacterium]|nr:ABC transporter substrate-binding protein [Planctomycetaceae bacterium]